MNWELGTRNAESSWQGKFGVAASITRTFKHAQFTMTNRVWRLKKFSVLPSKPRSRAESREPRAGSPL